MVWTIEAKMLPLVGISGHLYIDIFDDNGARVCQINGLATNPLNLKPRDIGLPGDLLKAYLGTLVLGGTENATRDHHPHKGRVLFRGDKKDIIKAIEAAIKAADYINQLDVPYRVLTINSNSVFTHIVKAISTVVDLDQQALKEAYGLKKFLPGVNGKITDEFRRAAGKNAPQNPPKNPPPPPPKP